MTSPSEKNDSLEAAINRIGQEIFKLAQADRKSFWNLEFWNDKLIELSLGNEALKVQLFRFIDVLPSLKSDQRISDHLQSYFGDEVSGLPTLLKLGASPLAKSKIGSKLAGGMMKKSVTKLAKRFIAGETPREALGILLPLWKEGLSSTLDLLGEKVVNEKEAGQFQQRYLELLEKCEGEMAGWPGPSAESTPRLNVSVKLSSLYSKAKPSDFEGTVEVLKERVRPIFRKAKSMGAFINLDLEDYHSKAVTFKVFQDLVSETEFESYPHFGLVIQAYLRESIHDVEWFIGFCRERGQSYTVRLVKGAYWDFETVLADQNGWPCPVFREKWKTDANYEQCLRLLLENHQVCRTAVATHNVRSIAVAMALAELNGAPPEAFEFQMLYGMADPLKQALHKLGYPIRQYVPVGNLLEGLAYLVRRLLENTSNESFLRQRFVESVSAEELLLPPHARESGAGEKAPAPQGFSQQPPLDFAIKENRRQMTQALAALKERLPLKSAPLIGGKEVRTERSLLSRNPAEPEQIVAEISIAGKAEADLALEAAKKALGEWRIYPARERAEILRKTAELYGKRRFELNALMVLETGKTWIEADGDTKEAMDFLKFYAGEMERLAAPRRTEIVPGEENFLYYQPKGVGVVIAPWNFPLAIATGMVSAGLVTGNCVLFKPAESSGMIGAMMTSLLHEAGVPGGALAFLPGHGEEIGAYLVGHPEVSFTVFTGSQAVGLEIVEKSGRTPPGQRHVKKVIAEMGGKNAIIVDDDADLDEAVRGIVSSAFGFQGQKCSAGSRLIVLEGIFERLMLRLGEAVRGLTVGPPEFPATEVGPMIDNKALEKVKSYIELGRKEGQVLAEASLPDGPGYFAAPIIFKEIAEDSPLLQEEIFGPVLVALSARNFDQALEMANNTNHKLTGGLYSRDPRHIEQAKREFMVGNLYINRGITGAIVQRQPFGGLGLSGIGAKAGGADYLLQFLNARTITENTLRQGFAPPVE